jgi:diguanylate cyclase (GGDEF)-like protein/putative nucleotidyltransferase with HDIG domain
MVDAALETGRAVSMIAIDLDDFGVLNDTVSHAEGDRYLREVAWTIRGAIGPDALLFRVGGDEFAVLLDGCDAIRATAVAESVAHDVRCISNPHVHDPSLTIGIAAVPEHASDAQELLQVATGTLYWGKLSGKASITCYDPAVVTVLSTEERVQAMEQNARLRAVLALARALDARDAYTARHSENVSRYAVAIAAELGWNPDRLELLRVAGLLHDVGKIGVRDSTLRKSSRLAEDEWAEMQTHPALGASMIAGVAPEEIIPWVISHHERMDGCGYPNELGGEDIPDGARILAVADTFDAMTSSRSYRPALSPLRAIDEIVKGAGPQFDPDAVRAFLRALRANTIDVRQVAELARTAPAQEQYEIAADEVALGEFVTLDPEFVGAAAVELFVPADEDLAA